MKTLNKKLRHTLRPGQWIRVFWEDVGVRDVIVIGVGDETDNIYVLEPMEGQQRVDWDQVVLITNRYITPPDYGT